MSLIGIGSNLGDRLQNCEHVVEMLSQDGRVKNIIKSRWYETEAVIAPSPQPSPTMGEGAKRRRTPFDSPPFINGVFWIETSLSPTDLLRLTQSIETKLGRARTGKKWEPRTIDLDILFYDDLIIDMPDLKIPHPELHKRMFVLRPLCDIALTFVHPVFGKTIKELFDIVRACREQQM